MTDGVGVGVADGGHSLGVNTISSLSGQLLTGSQW